MSISVLSLLLPSGCTGAGLSPTSSDTATATATATEATGHTGTTRPEPTDTGWQPPGPPLDASLDETGDCPYPSDPSTPGTLTATSTGGGAVALEYQGPVGGCTCGDELFAWTEGDSTIGLRIAAGDCDAIWCCELGGTLAGVPSGDWNVQVMGYGGASTSVTVP